MCGIAGIFGASRQMKAERLKELGQKTMKLAQRGEKEVVRASKIGRLQLDVVSFNLKKENAFRQIGKKVADMHSSKKSLDASKLTALFNQIEKANNQIKNKKSQISKLKKKH